MITQHAQKPATEARPGEFLIPEDRHRSSMYALLSLLLAKPPTKTTLTEISSLTGGDQDIAEEQDHAQQMQKFQGFQGHFRIAVMIFRGRWARGLSRARNPGPG